ncbi:alpha/beta hydrolase [Caulobacter sp.]|uniref:alpha/beta hydrolase n=1 Tax=Caulobacter sp. TaxID=78 RepID=UPI0031DA45B4
MDITWNRRSLLAAGLAATAAPAWSAEIAPEHIPLWPGLAPGGDKVRVVERLDPFTMPDGTIDNSVVGVTRPTLTIYPAQGTPSGLAVLVIPGGGFRKVVADKEGRAIARWLAGEGITAGVLVYRLPGDGWEDGMDAPLQDAQRALRLLRARSGAAKIGALGFSAGGTIAAALASRGGAPLYPPIDDLDEKASLPDFVGLGYPYLNVPAPRRPEQSMFRGFTTPTKAFLFHAVDDQRVSVENSRKGAAAIRAAGGTAEEHEYPTGGHGFALTSPPGAPAGAWPAAFLKWVRAL